MTVLESEADIYDSTYMEASHAYVIKFLKSNIQTII